MNVGPAVRSSTTPSAVAGTTPLYGWSVYRTLEPRFWRSGPTGGSCAVFGAVSTVAGRVGDDSRFTATITYVCVAHGTTKPLRVPDVARQALDRAEGSAVA